MLPLKPSKLKSLNIKNRQLSNKENTVAVVHCESFSVFSQFYIRKKDFKNFPVTKKATQISYNEILNDTVKVKDQSKNLEDKTLKDTLDSKEKQEFTYDYLINKINQYKSDYESSLLISDLEKKNLTMKVKSLESKCSELEKSIFVLKEELSTAINLLRLNNIPFNSKLKINKLKNEKSRNIVNNESNITDVTDVIPLSQTFNYLQNNNTRKNQSPSEPTKIKQLNPYKKQCLKLLRISTSTFKNSKEEEETLIKRLSFIRNKIK